MANPNKQNSIPEENTNGVDRLDEILEELSSVDVPSVDVEPSSVGSVGNLSVLRVNGSSGCETGFTERLTNILVDDGDGDLLLQQNDRETRVLQWLQALDLQVIGACRADERMKPLLKLNVSSGAAEDRLLAHLSQHFDPSEVGKLARCLCIPLVSIRVGKISKQGTLLCPTATRGNLNLTLLPTSDLRIAFVGDDGQTERLSTLTSNFQSYAVAIEEIPADNSGRSFFVKVPNGKVSYFWCSEKSTLLGIELLAKMKDLLEKKPSLAELTGISESRLDCFQTHLRAYLIGSRTTNTRPNSSTPDCTLDPSEVQFSSSLPKTSLRSRSHQGSLSPRSSSFKEGLPKNMSLKNVAREILKQRVENHISPVDSVSPIVTSSEISGMQSFSSSSFLESLGRSSAPPILNSASQVLSNGSSCFSPYYCWCPPLSSTLQYTIASPQLPLSSTQSFKSLPLPPLSSLLNTTTRSTPTSSLNLSSVPSTNLSDPFSIPTSQQIPTFTPLMCDSIVHIPVIDICSSGQGYLVNAGPAISTTIPLISEADSVLEKGARETLRLLIGSSNGEEKPNGILVSRGIYNGDAIANGIAALGLVSMSKRAIEGNGLDGQTERSGGTGSDDMGSSCSNLREETSD